MMKNQNHAFLPDRLFSGWFLSFLFALVFMFLGGPAFAQDFDGVAPEGIGSLFGSEHGDAFTSLFLNQMFGPLFPSADGSSADSVFSNIIGYFNVFILVVGGLMFFYNITVGVLQSAHEGEVLGRRWSSLWAPLRVIFAVGLLVPVPGLGGYNIAQAGVAYIVKGSTNFATMVWSASAEVLLGDDIAVAGGGARFDPVIFETLYRNEVCMRIVNEQLREIADEDETPNTVRYVPLASVTHFDLAAYERPNSRTLDVMAADRQERTWITALTDSDGNPLGGASTSWGSRVGVCGKYNLPDDPIFIKNIEGEPGKISESDASSIPPENRAPVRAAFRAAHKTAIDAAITGMKSLVDAAYPIVTPQEGEEGGLDPNLPSYQNEFATILTSVNNQLTEDMKNVRTLASNDEGAENVNHFGREALRKRITGNCSGEGEGTGSQSGAQFAENCYGEGWLGAGSWYMLIAQINNEIASLNAATPDASNGTYINDVDGENRAMYIASGGEYSSGWFGTRWGENLGEVDSMASAEDATLMSTRYMQIFTQSTQGLAALGFSLSAEAYASFRDMSNNNSLTAKLFDLTGITDKVHEVLQMFWGWSSPSNWGSDPMVGLMEIGRFLMNMSMLALVAGAGASFLFPGAAVVLTAIFYPVLIAGGAMSLILPMMPFLFWVLAVTAYFLLIAEALVAVNLWALSHMRMDGDGISGEAGSRGWLLLLALAFTPVLMIFGFMIGMTLFRVTTGLLDIGLYNAMQGIMNANILIAIIAILVYSVLIVLIYIVILERSFSLVAEFPGKVLSWVNVSAALDGGEAGRARGSAMASVYGASKAGQGVGKALEGGASGAKSGAQAAIRKFSKKPEASRGGAPNSPDTKGPPKQG